MQFNTIPGRTATKDRFVRSINEGKIPHAQLFSGAEGSGGLSMAIAYVAYLFCTQKSENDSCGKCAACLKVGRLIHPDLHFSFPFASSKKEDTTSYFILPWRNLMGKNPYFSLEDWTEELSIESKIENKMVGIPISECRQIIKELSMKPFEGSYQVLILWLPEFLKENSNSILKLVEEPAPGTLFLLVTENKDQILPTLLSRTQQIHISSPTKDEVRDYLQQKYSLTATASETIAFLAEGNLSKAYRMVNGEVNGFTDTFEEWHQVMREGNGQKIVDWVENFNGKTQKSGFSKEDKKNFLLFAIGRFREQCLKNQNSAKHLQVFSTIISELEKASYHLERNSNPKILFLDVSLQLSHLLKIQ